MIKCPKCGEPARVVVMVKAKIRCELLPSGCVGKVLSVSKDNEISGYECGGNHKWHQR